jgi:hypothetical protein
MPKVPTEDTLSGKNIIAMDEGKKRLFIVWWGFLMQYMLAINSIVKDVETMVSTTSEESLLSHPHPKCQ